MGETSGPEGSNLPDAPVLGGESNPKPLLGASKRLRKPRGGKNRKLDDTQRGIAIGMASVGVPQRKIAGALEVSVNNIEALVQKPDNNALIYEMREKLKVTKMTKALNLETKLWDLVEKKIDEGDAKAVDGAMRAVHASEKIQQAVAGESQKIEHTGVSPSVDLAGLIQVLIQQDGK